LLKKPVFGQTIPTMHTHTSVVSSPRELAAAQTLCLSTARAQAGHPGARYIPGSDGNRPRTSRPSTSHSDK
jgi:hypothetical protein